MTTPDNQRLGTDEPLAPSTETLDDLDPTSGLEPNGIAGYVAGGMRRGLDTPPQNTDSGGA
jgi:hypothetical protein